MILGNAKQLTIRFFCPYAVLCGILSSAFFCLSKGEYIFIYECYRLHITLLAFFNLVSPYFMIFIFLS